MIFHHLPKCGMDILSFVSWFCQLLWVKQYMDKERKDQSPIYLQGQMIPRVKKNQSFSFVFND